MPNVPYPDEVNCQIGQRKWFLNTNLFLIKSYLITKFDYIYADVEWLGGAEKIQNYADVM